MKLLKTEKPIVILISIITFLLFLTLLVFVFKPTIIGNVVEILEAERQQDPSLVLNLTFDDISDPWKDYSLYHHTFFPQGGIKWADKASCKLYGCADFSDTRGDYLNSTTKFSLNNGIATSFWIYLNREAGDGGSNSYWLMGNNQNLKWIEDSGYGINSHWTAENGMVGDNVGSSKRSQAKKWIHYFIQYNESEYRVWKDGALIGNLSQSYGNLNYTVGELIKIGEGLSSIDIEGYLDELMIWNRSDFTNQNILDLYNSQKFGTPPDRDLFVKDIKYELPIDWSSSNKELSIGASMPIIITIANAGIKDSGDFDFDVELDGKTICSNSMSLNAKSENNYTCNWEPAEGFHKGKVILDTSNSIKEDNENNNMQRLYIPFLERPWFHFGNLEWQNVLQPYCEKSKNIIAYDSCSRYKSFVSEDFDKGWYGNNVDPRGKKGRENAMACMLNNYDMSKEQCKRARNHLFGWASRPLASYNNVQAIHELVQVGITYDLMFKTLTKEENILVSKELYDICQYITNDVRPDLDNSTLILGGNGRGFGSGMGGFCYTLIGAYDENPTLIQRSEEQYWGSNIPDEWMDRETSYLNAYKDDGWAKYQEGWLYKFYSQYHLLENWLFEKRYGLGSLDNYQNALCSMGRELVTDVLDNTYNGRALRNDEDNKFRGVQRGDSNSYEDISSGSILGWSIADYYGVLCNDINTKKALLNLRGLAYSSGESTRSLPEIYIYKQLRDQASPENPSEFFPKVIFDNANDILTIRTNYSYVNDNVIEIDGGEEKGSGHSQAQGYYLYALGEPFLDYEQVPFNDDTRMDVWKNGISLQNTEQAVEGTKGLWNSQCGAAGYNQYYGMQTCPTPKYPEDYPNYRQFPLEYGGDLEDYIGTKDAKFAGVYVWRPYKNADPVKEYFVKFGDLLAKRTIVSNNKEGKGVYHNFINVYNEFTEARNGADLTLSRNGRNLGISLVYSTQQFTLGGGQSDINICFAKTDCSGSNRGNSQYRRTYLYTTSNDVDFILAHHWYYDGKKQPITALTSADDKGLQQGDNVIIFDSNNDNKIAYSDKEASGWALAFNDNTKEIGAFNTNYIKIGGIELFSAESPISAHLRRYPDEIIITVNTMERNKYIDYPKKVKVTVDAQELSNNNNFAITKNGNENIRKISESGTKVTFEAESGQNSDYYSITGVGDDKTPPTILSSKNTSTTNDSSDIQVQTNENANLSVSWGYADINLGNSASNSLFQAASSVSLRNLIVNSTIFYNVNSCDRSGNCITSEIYNFRTAETKIAANPRINQSPSQPISISGISLLPKTNKADISWTTNQLSDSRVNYGINGSLGEIINDSKQTREHKIALTNLQKGAKYYINITSCAKSECASSNTLNFETIFLRVDKYDGETTDFSKLDLDDVKEIVLERKDYGKIRFIGNINIARKIDIDSFTNISGYRIFVNSSSLPELNVSAIITLYNVTLKNPRIMKDETACPESMCRVLNYTNSTLVFNVTGFSEYFIEETPLEPEPQTASSSSSGGSSGGSSGSSGGGGTAFVCNQDWKCEEWSGCIEGLQTRNCNFVNISQHTQDAECPKLENTPQISQSCAVISNLPPETEAQVETKPIEISLDLSINISKKKIKAGNNLNADVTIKAVGTLNKINVSMKYAIKNSKNTTIYYESETINVEKSTKFTKTFKVPQDLQPGNYYVAASAAFESSSAVSSDEFVIVKKYRSFLSIFTTNVAYVIKPSINKLIAHSQTIAALAVIAMMLSVIPVLYFVRSYNVKNQLVAGLSKEEKALFDYIVKTLKQGISKEKIEQAVLNTGWKKETSDRIFDIAMNAGTQAASAK